MLFVRRGEKPSAEKIEELASTGIHEVLCELLLMRGIDSPEKIQRFFAPSEAMLLDPFAFAGMQDTVQLIEEMVEAGVPIAVYADFDCDGVCGAAILYFALKRMGAEVKVYIPDRFTEGYGTNARAVELLCEEAGLLITVDCGIRSVEDVDIARDMGVEVVILDHHECGSVLPDTPYILNPKVPGEPYPFRHLCGAGVAFKLACALLGEEAMDYIDIAAVATVGDIVSLTGENRAIAALGIQKLKENPSAGLLALMQCAGVNPKKVDSYSLSFMMVPRLNVAGRIEHAFCAFDLLVCADKAQAAEKAEKLNELNDRRKTIQMNITKLAEEQVEEDGRIIMVQGKGFHQGVVGLVAARLAERHYRPAVVFHEENGKLVGSARSIAGVNIYEVLDSMSEKYTRFGGHEQAAGLTLPVCEFMAVKAGVERYAREHIDQALFMPKDFYDVELAPEHVTMELAQSLMKMEPFGQDNPPAAFLMRGVTVADVRKLGKNQEHTKAKLGDLTCLYFGGALEEGGRYDLLGSVAVNEYMGKKEVQFIVRRACESCLNRDVEGQFLRAFPTEVRALSENCAGYEAQDVLCKIQGTAGSVAVVVNSWAGADMARQLPGFLEHAQKPQAPGRDIVYACRELPEGYDAVYLLGAFSLQKFFPRAQMLYSEELHARYREEAGVFFVDVDQLRECYRALKSLAGGFSSLSQLLLCAVRKTRGLTVKNMWFALNVFFEQKLIALSKGDKIHIIFLKGGADPKESALYAAMKGLARGEQHV